MGTVLGWLGYQVGQRTDAADATGSLHAKIPDIKNYLSSTIYSYLTNTVNANVAKAPWVGSKTPTHTAGDYNTTITTTTDILTITGPRIILGGFIHMPHDLSRITSLIVDGVTWASYLNTASTDHGIEDFVQGSLKANSHYPWRHPVSYLIYPDSTSAYIIPPVFMLPMMYIASGFIIRCQTTDSYTPKMTYQIIHVGL